jgi:hypothetical protein
MTQKEGTIMNRYGLTNEEILEILCAPEPTDDLSDIDFDGMDSFYGDEEADRRVVDGWLSDE